MTKKRDSIIRRAYKINLTEEQIKILDNPMLNTYEMKQFLYYFQNANKQGISYSDSAKSMNILLSVYNKERDYPRFNCPVLHLCLNNIQDINILKKIALIDFKKNQLLNDNQRIVMTNLLAACIKQKEDPIIISHIFHHLWNIRKKHTDILFESILYKIEDYYQKIDIKYEFSDIFLPFYLKLPTKILQEIPYDEDIFQIFIDFVNSFHPQKKDMDTLLTLINKIYSESCYTIHVIQKAIIEYLKIIHLPTYQLYHAIRSHYKETEADYLSDISFCHSFPEDLENQLLPFLYTTTPYSIDVKIANEILEVSFDYKGTISIKITNLNKVTISRNSFYQYKHEESSGIELLIFKELDNIYVRKFYNHSNNSNLYKFRPLTMNELYQISHEDSSSSHILNCISDILFSLLSSNNPIFLKDKDYFQSPFYVPLTLQDCLKDNWEEVFKNKWKNSSKYQIEYLTNHPNLSYILLKTLPYVETSQQNLLLSLQEDKDFQNKDFFQRIYANTTLKDKIYSFLSKYYQKKGLKAYSYIHLCLDYKIKIKLDFHSQFEIDDEYHTLEHQVRSKILPSMKIPPKSIFNHLLLPQGWTRILTKESLIDKTEQFFYQITYHYPLNKIIDEVNKDKSAIYHYHDYKENINYIMLVGYRQNKFMIKEIQCSKINVDENFISEIQEYLKRSNILYAQLFF